MNSAMEGWLLMKPVSVHVSSIGCGAPAVVTAASQKPLPPCSMRGCSCPGAGPIGGVFLVFTAKSSSISSRTPMPTLVCCFPLIAGNSSHFILRTSGLVSSDKAAVLHISCIAVCVPRCPTPDHSRDVFALRLAACVIFGHTSGLFKTEILVYDCCTGC